jgi:SNF2 family DNA or RNA helicase
MHPSLETDEQIQQRALTQAQEAARHHHAKTRQFDSTIGHVAHMQQAPGDDFSQPKMLHGSLKPYQLKGVAWLVNLYNQVGSTSPTITLLLVCCFDHPLKIDMHLRALQGFNSKASFHQS